MANPRVGLLRQIKVELVYTPEHWEMFKDLFTPAEYQHFIEGLKNRPLWLCAVVK